MEKENSSMKKDNYIVEFLILQKSYFCVWHSDDKDVFWAENSQIQYFENPAEAEKLCKKNGAAVQSDDIAKYNVDKLKDALEQDLSEIDCNFFIDFWNIMSDAAYSVDEVFYGDSKELNSIYQKMFYGLNLPSINKSGKRYTPIFSEDEQTEIVKVFKEGIRILEKQFRLKI